MLTLTENAATIIRRLAVRVGNPGTCGLRIGTQAGSPDNFSVELVAVPEPGDAVIEVDGARVFLDAQASPRFSGQEMDAVVEEGAIRFALRERD